MGLILSLLLCWILSGIIPCLIIYFRIWYLGYDITLDEISHLAFWGLYGPVMIITILILYYFGYISSGPFSNNYEYKFVGTRKVIFYGRKTAKIIRYLSK